MAAFTRHTPETAPEGSKALMETASKRFGMIPNLHAYLAESPETYDAYVQLTELMTRSSLSPTERHVVWLAINVANTCHYCVPAHTFLAKKDGVDDAVIDALRDGRPLPDVRLEALRRFTLSMLDNRGNVDAADVDAFLAAGFTQRNVLEVILGISHKTLSNFANHILHTPVDAPFARHHWDPPAQAAE